MSEQKSQMERNLEKDYTDNYRPRTEIKIELNLEDIVKILEDPFLLTTENIVWHFQFYIRQAVLQSVKKLLSADDRVESRLTGIFERYKIMGEHKHALPIVTYIKLTLFEKKMSDYDLYQIFDGTYLYDMACAQIAYDEYIKRQELKI